MAEATKDKREADDTINVFTVFGILSLSLWVCICAGVYEQNKSLKTCGSISCAPYQHRCVTCYYYKPKHTATDNLHIGSLSSMRSHLPSAQTLKLADDDAADDDNDGDEERTNEDKR